MKPASRKRKPTINLSLKIDTDTNSVFIMDHAPGYYTATEARRIAEFLLKAADYLERGPR